MQTSLFDLGAPTFDAAFRGVERRHIGAGAWVEYVPRFMVGHARLFSDLRDHVQWRTTEREMYEQVVPVPRLLARFPADGTLPKILIQLGAVLSRRYHADLHSVAAAYYRSGADSVASHGDRLKDRHQSTIAILSLGEPRRFHLRPKQEGDPLAFSLGWGDLFVMGGTCQETWTHGIPKCAFAGPRISIQYREVGKEVRRVGALQRGGQRVSMV